MMSEEVGTNDVGGMVTGGTNDVGGMVTGGTKDVEGSRYE
jgi:hypothetical protein